jgi:hypothetical protein
MLRFLKKWFWGESFPRSIEAMCKANSQKPNRARLVLELLESRELLTGPYPGFTLDSSGNLYNTTGTQPQLIDTAVQNFAVANNEVYDLHTNGALQAMNGDGSGKATLATSVQSFAVAANGTLYWLTVPASGGWLEMLTLGLQIPLEIDTNVSTFAVDSSGDAVALEEDGHLVRFGPNSTVLIDTGVSTFVVGDGGQDVYWLTGGTLWESVNAGASKVDPIV